MFSSVGRKGRRGRRGEDEDMDFEKERHRAKATGIGYVLFLLKYRLIVLGHRVCLVLVKVSLNHIGAYKMLSKEVDVLN